MPTSRPPNKAVKADVDPEAYRDTVMTSAKAQIANSDATLKAGREALDDEAEAGLSQAEKFEKAARDLGADQDEDAFKGVLRKLPARQASQGRRLLCQKGLR